MKTPPLLSDILENILCVVPSHGLLHLRAETLAQAAQDAAACGRKVGYPTVKWICSQENWGSYKASALLLTSGLPARERHVLQVLLLATDPSSLQRASTSTHASRELAVHCFPHSCLLSAAVPLPLAGQQENTFLQLSHTPQQTLNQ